MNKWTLYSAACFSGLLFTVFFLSCQSVQTPEKDTRPSVQRMSKEQLRKKLDDPRLVLIDTRVKQQWDKAEHKIPGAMHRSPWEGDEWGKKLPRDRIVVTYCS